MGKLVFDANLCTGCRACELACSFSCEGVFAPSRSRIKVVKDDDAGFDVPVGCAHCEDPPCQTVCPVRAIARDADTDAVLIDHDICIGCKECMVACPFGAIQYNAEKRIFYKCDLCAGEPECVKWCFTGALKHVTDIAPTLDTKRRKSAQQTARAARESAHVGE